MVQGKGMLNVKENLLYQHQLSMLEAVSFIIYRGSLTHEGNKGTCNIQYLIRQYVVRTFKEREKVLLNKLKVLYTAYNFVQIIEKG